VRDHRSRPDLLFVGADHYYTYSVDDYFGPADEIGPLFLLNFISARCRRWCSCSLRWSGYSHRLGRAVLEIATLSGVGIAADASIVALLVSESGEHPAVQGSMRVELTGRR